MEISVPLNLMPQSRPPPTFAPFKLSNAGQTPRRFNTTIPANLPQRRLQTRDPTPPRPIYPTPRTPEEAHTNPWKMTREFDEILQSYSQPESDSEPGPQPYVQDLVQQPEILQQIQPSLRSDFRRMTNPKEIVHIGFNPKYGVQRPLTPDGSRAPSPVDNQKAKSIEEISHPVTPPHSYHVENTGYSPEWITQETQDITNAACYDPDPDHGIYTYENDTYNLAPPAETIPTVDIAEDLELEGPRQVPYDHRETMFFVKEDIDFFMALVGGSDPPTATTETQAVIAEEQEIYRRSEDAEIQESSLRRQEELKTMQSDLDFWMSLMERA